MGTEETRTTLILGTAGHIDHGKSSLVKALTGVDPDRLPEERKRGMTIDLGFAHLDVASNGVTYRFGVVDVPGHERFVRTMVAGATGIDIAMLVVAADDGWMPQTQEHADILDLLGVRRGVVVLSKSDIAPDERRAAVREEIAERVRGTLMRDWPIVETSARTGAGIDTLLAQLAEVAASLAVADASPVFRLAIDRVFSVHGRGTVVTGSVLSGRVHVGDELQVLPNGGICRVREVQTHGEVVDDAIGGQRAALNLTGVERDALERGMELATPGYLEATRYVDARVRLLGSVDGGIRSHRRVRMLIGTSEAMATLVVIGGGGMEAGAEAFAQLRVHRPIVAGFSQRFILRDETAAHTIGGGAVIRPCARRVRPNLDEASRSIAMAASEDPGARLAEALRDAGFDSLTHMALAGRIGVEAEDVTTMMAALTERETLVEMDGRLVHRETLERLLHRVSGMLLRHHAAKPGEPGIQRDRLIGWISARSAPTLGKRLLAELERRGVVVERGPYRAHRDFRPAMSIEDENAMAKVVTEIESAGFDPPAWDKLRAVRSMSRQRAKSLADIAKTDPRLVYFALGCYISARSMEAFREAVNALGSGGKRFKLADVRDKTGQSRRVVQPLLEHLDRVGVTKRVGDERILL
ncbi:MAG TPA: selenocysteine-specific translation elongation factor [Phycisphaerae bacterium]|nr:selenocysteine-specific translation elongation factor [Phycisphaerae bacterium]HRW52779.1 selenocysteine-specific translation elongation factor [Phycisphaerae bacterium]